MHRGSRLLLLAAAFTPHVAHAWQRTPPAATVRLGELVRVRTTNRTNVRGTLAFASRDSLVISDGEGARRALRADIVSVVYARRMIPWDQRAKRGALVGAAIGFLVPVVQSLKKGKHCQSPPPPPGWTPCEPMYDNIDETAGLGSIFFGIIGFGVGASIPWHHWARADIAVIGTRP